MYLWSATGGQQPTIASTQCIILSTGWLCVVVVTGRCEAHIQWWGSETQGAVLSWRTRDEFQSAADRGFTPPNTLTWTSFSAKEPFGAHFNTKSDVWVFGYLGWLTGGSGDSQRLQLLCGAVGCSCFQSLLLLSCHFHIFAFFCYLLRFQYRFLSRLLSKCHFFSTGETFNGYFKWKTSQIMILFEHFACV